MEEVIDAFRNDIAFYKNGISRFASYEYPSEHMNKVRYEKPRVHIVRNYDDEKVFTLIKLGVNYNLSSISIRRQFANEVKKGLSNLRVGYVDSFLFYAAVKNNCSIGYCTSMMPSTIVRSHKNNSREYFSSKPKEIEAVALINSLNTFDIQKTCQSPPSVSLIYTMIHLDVIDESIKSGLLRRGSVAIELIHLLKDKYAAKLRRDLIIKMCLYIISASLLNIFLSLYRRL